MKEVPDTALGLNKAPLVVVMPNEALPKIEEYY